MVCKCRCAWKSITSTIFFVVLGVTIGLFLVHRKQPSDVCYVGNDKHKTIFSFFGPPGSGKGTLAQECVNRCGFRMLSTGNLIRDHIARATPLGKELKKYTESGALVPDDIVAAMVKGWLELNLGGEKPVILDGFPRTHEQAKLLNDMLKKYFPDYRLRIVVLAISDDDVVKRISKRLMCSNKACQAIYNTDQFVQGQALVCTQCGATLSKRADDNEDVVRERLRVYAQTNTPLRDFYMRSGIHIEELDVTGKTPDEVFSDFVRTIVHGRRT